MGKRKGGSRQQGAVTRADGSVTMESRPATLEVLSTWTGDSAPSILVTAHTERVVFNAPEGWQRLCVEQGVKVSKVDAVCVTSLGPAAVGGVPGYALTAADSGATAFALVGPPGAAAYVASTRHFMQRDNFQIHVKEMALGAGADAEACFASDVDGGARLVTDRKSVV